MEDNLFFVGIRDPLELRKELLTDSKMLLDGLKQYEKYKGIREEKSAYILELKRVFDELLILNKKLRGRLPKVPVKIPQVMPEREPPKALPKKVEETRRPEPTTKLELLEQELAKIEQRLGSLD